MMSDRTSKSRPVKPRGSLRIPVLKLHGNGQWYMTKRINGRKRFYYFGKDPDQAQVDYLKVAADIQRGVQPTTSIDPSKVTVLELTDRFIVHEEQRFRAGDIHVREFDDLRSAALRFREWAGESKIGDEITDLVSFRSWLRKQMKLNSFNRNIVKVKKMLKWAFKRKPPLITTALHEDDSLSKAKKKLMRREQRETEEAHGTPIYEPTECRLFVCAAVENEDWQYLAQLLLAMNGGMGQSHLSDLPDAEVETKKLEIDWVRPKTEEICQVPLWPITAEAIDKVRAVRAKPAAKEFAALLFLTRNGYPWVREFFDDANGVIGNVSPNDEIGKLHREYEKDLKIGGVEIKRKGRAFYAFRRTFSTNANNTMDKDAVRRIMGHSLEGMDPHYVRGKLAIPIDRRRAVTDYVHRVLFGCEPSELTLKNVLKKLKPTGAAAAVPG